MKIKIYVAAFLMGSFSISSGAQTNTFPASGNAGVGTTTPQKALEVRTGTDNFSSTGEVLSPGQYSGIHFGYLQTNNQGYRKSALVFERVDNAARGKIHVLNNGGDNNSSASLADAKLTIDYQGRVGIGQTNPVTALHVINPVAAGTGNTSTPEQGLLVGAMNTSGALNLGVDPSISGNFYSWIQSRSIASNSFFNLALNPYGGKVGVGIRVPEAPLHVHSAANSGIRVSAEGKSTSVYLNIAEGNYGIISLGGNTNIRGSGQSSTFDGKVGIGTGAATLDHELDVNGTIHTKEVKVDLTVPGPDYVFEPDYDLATLAEIETYIKENKHLPEVPSAKEMEENGMNLKEMNLILLKKVEELTLHLIEMKKENENQQQEINALKNR